MEATGEDRFDGLSSEADSEGEGFGASVERQCEACAGFGVLGSHPCEACLGTGRQRPERDE